MEHLIGFKPVPSSGKLPEIVDESFENALYEDVPIEDYHADRTAVSQSGLKYLEDRIWTPQHFHYHWTKGSEATDDGGELKISQKRCFRVGSIAHEAFLERERFRSRVVVEPEFIGLTKEGKPSAQSAEAKAKRADWWAKQRPGTLVVTQDESDMIVGMVHSLTGHKNTTDIMNGAKTEISGWFRDPATGIKCRVRPDLINFNFKNKEYLLVSDLKTTSKSAHADVFYPQAARLFYHAQLAMQYDGVVAITGRVPDVACWLVVETAPPYACAVHPLNKTDLETGRAVYQAALLLLKKCLEHDYWPSHQADGAEDGALPPWAHTQQAPMYNFDE